MLKLAIAPLVLATALVCSCGKGDPNQVGCEDPNTGANLCTASLTASDYVVSTYGKTSLTAQTNYFDDPSARWSIQEADLNLHNDCSYTDASQASFDVCAYGYIIYNRVQPPYTATFYAGPNPGLYHVFFSADPKDGSGPLISFVGITIHY